MTLLFACPHCGKELRAKESIAGRKVACHGCKQPLYVPQSPHRVVASRPAAPRSLAADPPAPLLEPPITVPPPRQAEVASPSVATSLSPSAELAPGSFDERPSRPWSGASSGAGISGLVHGAALIVLSLLAVSNEQVREVLFITGASQEPFEELDELEDLIVEKMEPLEPEETDVAAPDPISASESDIGEIGVATESALASESVAEPDVGGLLDTDLRQAIFTDLGGRAGGKGKLRDVSFNDMIAYAQEHGLEIVVTMDSTGSMGGEIETVKKRILTIGTALLKKVPGTRFSIVSYKDLGEEYVVKGLPLTSDLDEVSVFLQGIRAGGGGDAPEAVEFGLQWAVQKNEFRPRALKVILVFGDQPPHNKDFPLCLTIANEFHRQHNGVVSTITCRQPVPIPHFYEIARAGGGEAFTLQDSRRIMEELIVLVFGNKHRQDVTTFFELDAAEAAGPAADPAIGLGMGMPGRRPGMPVAPAPKRPVRKPR